MTTYSDDEAAVTYTTSVKWLLVLAIVGANIGYSEYVSISFIAVISLAVISANGEYLYLLKRHGIQISFAIIFTILYWIYLPFNDAAVTHSILSQTRESLMLFIIIIFCTNKNDTIKKACYGASIISSYVVAALIYIQFLQLFLNSSPIGLPKNWFMIDYNSTLVESFNSEATYLRPSALYSEPSVSAAVLVPAFYLFLKKREIAKSAFIAVAIYMSASVYGIIATLLISLIQYLDKRKIIFTFFISLGCIAVLYFFSEFFKTERIIGIMTGEDDSLKWRFSFPLAYLQHQWLNDDIGPKHVKDLMLMSADIYNASIFDTWIIYTFAKLGIVLGFIWIFYVVLSIPYIILPLFLFHSLLSGAPLYHDKTLMLMVFGLSISMNNTNKSNI